MNKVCWALIPFLKVLLCHFIYILSSSVSGFVCFFPLLP